MRQFFRGWRSARSWAATDQRRVDIFRYYPFPTNYFTSKAVKLFKRFWKIVDTTQPQVQKDPKVRQPFFKNVEARDQTRLGRSRSLCALNSTTGPNASQFASKPFASIREVAHQLFVNNVLRRVSNSQTQELRRRTVRQLFGGNSAPFFALVGVSLASGTGIITKEDEIECVCKEVRQTARKTRDHLSNVKEDNGTEKPTTWTLNDFAIGPAIAKGCSAVVYSAKCLANGFQTLGGGNQQSTQQNEEYPLALKMMFNFHAESKILLNVITILIIFYLS